MTQNARGGARIGAGRPSGSRNKATIEREALASEAIARLHGAGIANSALTDADVAGMSALDIMSYAMTSEAVAGRWMNAAALAKEIAPYRFAKLTSTRIDATVRSFGEMSDAELEALIADCDGQDDVAEGTQAP